MIDDLEMFMSGDPGDTDPTRMMVSRQTEAFGRGIIEIIKLIGMAMHQQGEPPALQSVCGALVSVLAHHVAGTPEAERQIATDKMCEMLRQMVPECVANGHHAQLKGYAPEEAKQ